MQAEREDFRTAARKPKQEPRLAYEIALGIVIGGVILMGIDLVGSYIGAKIIMGQMQFGIPR